MKKITESQLLDKVSRLKEYMSAVEAEQQNEGIGSTIWNGIKSAGSAVGNALNTTAGKVAGGAALGAGALAAGQKLAGGAAPAPTGAPV